MQGTPTLRGRFASGTCGDGYSAADEDDAGDVSATVRFQHEENDSSPSAPSRAVLQTFLGFVEKIDDAGGTLWLCHDKVSIRRVFETAFLQEKGIIEEGQPVELSVVVEAGDPKLVLRPLALEGERRPFKIVEGIDYPEFRSLDE